MQQRISSTSEGPRHAVGEKKRAGRCVGAGSVDLLLERNDKGVLATKVTRQDGDLEVVVAGVEGP